MKGSYNEYMSSAVEEFLEDTNRGKILFIKHYNSFYVNEEDISNVVKESDRAKLLFHKYNNSEIQDPYEPFLEWIKDLYIKFFKKQSIDEFLDKCDVYYLHKSIFKSYIESGVCIRKEEIIISEIKYEKIMFIKSLCNIFCYISSKVPLIIVLNELHLSNPSVIEFIKGYIADKREKRILFLASYNEAYKINDRFSKVCEDLCDVLEKNNLIVDSTLDEKADFLEERYDFFPNDSEFANYIIKINNMIITLAYEQALYYLDRIYDTRNIENEGIPFRYKQSYLQLYALTNLYLGDTSKAILLCDESMELCKVQEAVNDDYSNYLFECNYISGIAQVYKGQYYIGEDYAEKCLNIAEKENNEFLIFRAKLLKYTALFRGWKGVFLCDVNYAVDMELLVEFRKFDYVNHLAYLDMVGYESNFWKTVPKIEAILKDKTFVEGINIAKKIKNDAFLYLAYNKIITTASIQSEYKIVEEYYRRSLRVAKRLNDKEKQADVLNGLGYNLLGEEKYSEAAENFNKAIEVLYDINSINKIAEVLYNMGINAFVAGSFEEANKLFLQCLKMIEYLRIGCIQVCNITKIYGFIAFCNYYMKKYYNCNYYLKKMERILSHLLDPSDNPSYTLWDDDLFLYYLLNSMMLKLENKYEDVEINLNKAEIHMRKSSGSLFYSAILLAIEKADFYKRINQEKEADEVILDTIKYYKSRKYYKKAAVLEAIYNKEPLKNEETDLGLNSIDSKVLLDVSRRIGAEKELIEERKELSFILMWQDILNKKYISEDDLIKNSMVLLRNNFFVDKILYINVLDNMKGKIIYNDINPKLDKNDVDKIINYFSKSNREFVICREDKNIDMYKDIIDIFGKKNVFSIIGIPIFENAELKNILIAYIPVYNNFLENKFRLTERHIYIFKYIFKQLLDALYKMRVNKKIENINKQLHQMAVTDILTGIYNRQGFEKIVEDNNKILTILYIDLDNFKFFNDSYGHDVGDYILVSFAKVFKKVIKNKGYAVRYGGDEFVLAIENGNNDEGVRAARYIYEFINEDKFIDNYKKKIGKDADKCDKLSCSIGIATSKSSDKESIVKAIMDADEVLYEVKKSGKGQYKVHINKDK